MGETSRLHEGPEGLDSATVLGDHQDSSAVREIGSDSRCCPVAAERPRFNCKQIKARAKEAYIEIACQLQRPIGQRWARPHLSEA